MVNKTSSFSQTSDRHGLFALPGSVGSVLSAVSRWTGWCTSGLWLPRRCAAAVCVASLACGSAWAQWQWVDATGRKVFSDTAPPLSVPDTHILKRPGMHNPPPAAAPAPAAATPEVAPGPQLSGRDGALEARKKQAEEAAQAKKKADEERQAKSRTENCERAQRAKATLASGIRLATTNAKGEREILDDAGRAAESKRLDGIIRSECGPKPAAQAAQTPAAQPPANPQ